MSYTAIIISIFTLIMVGVIYLYRQVIINYFKSLKTTTMADETIQPGVTVNVTEQPVTETPQVITEAASDTTNVEQPITKITSAPQTALDSITSTIEAHNAQVGIIISDLTAIATKLDPILVSKINATITSTEQKVVSVAEGGIIGKVGSLLATKSTLLNNLGNILNIFKEVI